MDAHACLYDVLYLMCYEIFTSSKVRVESF